jgi:hypothetical protein
MPQNFVQVFSGIRKVAAYDRVRKLLFFIIRIRYIALAFFYQGGLYVLYIFADLTLLLVNLAVPDNIAVRRRGFGKLP